MDNNNQTQPAIDVQGLIQDIQNTVWGILESNGVNVADKDKWSAAMHKYIPTRPKKKQEEKDE